MRIKDIPIKGEDLIIGVDYTQGKDLTCISMYMTVEKYKELERLAEIGVATEVMFAHGECDNYIGQINKTHEGQFVITGEVFGSTEKLVEWYRKEVE